MERYSNAMRVIGCLVSIAVLTAVTASAGNRDVKLQIKITAEKSAYSLGEPIELRYSVTNFGKLDCVIALDYPYLRSSNGQGGIELQDGESTVTSGRQESLKNELFPVRILRPGETLLRKIYLQRFLCEQLSLGKRSFSYKARIVYVERNPAGEQSETADGAGEFAFTVVPPDEKKLRELFDGYLKKTARWRDAQEPIEALSVVYNPIVIPYLVTLIFNSRKSQVQ